MTSKVHPRKGMQLFDAGGELIGMIAGARGNSITVNGRHIPKSAVARVTQGRVYLKEGAVAPPAPKAATARRRREEPRRRAKRAAAPPSLARPAAQVAEVMEVVNAPAVVPLGAMDAGMEVSAMSTDECAPRRPRPREVTGALVVPLAEERLHVEKRQADLGEVRVLKTVVEERQSIPIELEREEVVVRERDVPDRPVQPGRVHFQEGVVAVPLQGEEAVVYKEAVVTGEVLIAKERVAERRQIAGTVRAERVDVEGVEYQDRPARPAPPRRAAVPIERPAVRALSAAMRGEPQIRAGMEVVGANANPIGRVKEVRHNDFLVDRRMQRDIYVPITAVRDVRGERIVLDVPNYQIDNMGWPTSSLAG